MAGKRARKIEKDERLAPLWRTIYSVAIGLLFVAGATAVLLFPILPSNQYDLALGSIPPEDILAPREISYISEIETSEAQEVARSGIADQFDPPNPSIGRQQVRKAQRIMAFVVDVRADAFADSDLKLNYLEQTISLGSLSEEARTTLLNMSESQFDQVSAEVVSLVEEAMSGTVKEGRESEVLDQIELKVSPDIPEDHISLVVAVARNLVVANSAYNEAATLEAQDAAVAAVPEIRRSFKTGEVVVRAGEPVDDLDLEALTMLGLSSEHLTWEDVASAVLLNLMGVVIAAVFLVVLNPRWRTRSGYILLVAALTLLFLVLAQIMVSDQLVTAYLFPAAALSLSLTALVGVEFAVLVTVVLGVLSGVMAGNSLELTVFLITSGTLAAGSLRRVERLNHFFGAGVFASIAGAAILLVFRLPVDVSSFRLAQLLLISLLNGLLSAGIALVILFVVGSLTSITTSLQLIDLSRPDHPLQKRLQQEALGTYQHTLSVANLAEAAAQAIGANSLLTRVGTLYHDIGKMVNPGFFIENRTKDAPDPYEDLSPLASAQIIKAHVADGLELARRHRLPPEITAFICEHHGTMPIIYFLAKAREEAQQSGTPLDEKPFHYDGPAPASPETAIVMLADCTESAARANQPQTEEDIEALVTRLIQQRIDYHQLDKSGLTLTDIMTIKDTIVRTLKGMYHPRIKYPGDERPARLTAGAGAALAAGEQDAAEGVVVERMPEPEPVESTEREED